jgi:dodecin
MSEHVYKTIEITGTSDESSDQAVRNAIAKAAETIKNIEWLEVTETRGQVVKNKLKFWQVTMKLGFRIE